MADEICTTAELVEFAVLRKIVIHELCADLNSEPDQHGVELPPDELRAPGCAEDDAAVTFHTRLDDDSLGVRCRIETANAYATFVVDGEAIFDLPAPVSLHDPNIVSEFTEQVGAPAVFPYMRSAVAALAAQLSVPASPLPILRPGDLELTGGHVAEEAPSDMLMHGTMSATSESGAVVQLGEFFVDGETGILTRIGGEGQTPEVDELLGAISELPPPEELTVEWMIRRFGEDSVRQHSAGLLTADGENLEAEIDAAVAHIAAQDAFNALHDAVEALGLRIDASRNDSQSQETHSADLTALLEAAEQVRDSWDRVRLATTD